MYRFILPTVLLLASSAALSADSDSLRREARDQARLNKMLDGLTPGRPTSCISPRTVSSSDRIGDKIIYRVSRRQLYVTDTGGGCSGLRRGDAIVTSTPSGQLCRGDIVRTVDLVTQFPSGSCTFGDFIPYTRAK